MSDEKLVNQKPDSEEDKTSKNEKAEILDEKKLEADSSPKKEDKKDESFTAIKKQKEHFQSKAEKLQKELDEVKSQSTKKVDGTKVETIPIDIEKSKAEPKFPEDIETRLETVEFIQKNPTIPKEVLAEVMDYSKGTGKSLEESMESPLVKAFVDKHEKEKALEDAIPDITRNLKVQPEKPLKEMTREEHKAYWEEYMSK